MDLVKLAEMILVPGMVFLVFLGFFFEWLDRKFYARLQNRYGPLHTGFAGILQPLADFVKLLAKEDIEPEAVDKSIFRATPIVLLAIPLLASLFVPMVDMKAVINFEGDLVFVIFLLVMYAVSVFLAAWSSTSPYSTVGGVRAAYQLLGFEIPLTIALLTPAIKAESLSISGIAQWQATNLPFILLQPLAFGVAILCLLAELEQVPFDIPEAKTEIVGGWQTEFSGRKLALLRLSADVELVLAASLVTALFLGGPSGPSPIPPIVWFLVKSIVVVFIFSNLRALFARFRIDQMVHGNWKYLVPLAALQVMMVELLP
ncbi:MAG: complex I subunit 1 family protein [Candidatus Bathyarchaeia archaeon]